MNNYLQGQKFRELSDNNKIYYCETHNIHTFFKGINFTHDFILITHNSDDKVDNVRNLPTNLKHWFAQNVCINHPKIESIPIGLENTQWFPEIGKIDKMKTKINEERNFKNLLYINHNINTNYNERYKPYQLFRNKSFVTCVEGKNGEGFESYLDNIYNHKFVLCPEGNGTDTHRTWECLYMGTIPIEKRNINNSFYTDLPICFVNDWEEITESFLNTEYERIKNTKFNLEKLDFDYWRKRIINSL
jgi:hypothetical protein